MALEIREMHLNATDTHVTAETDWHPVEADSREELLESLREQGTPETLWLSSPGPNGGHLPSPASHEEHDGCTPGGWVFSRDEPRGDGTQGTYRHEVWVEVRDADAEPAADFEAG